MASARGNVGAEETARKWWRRLITLKAGLVTLLVFAIVAGVLFPFLGWVTAFGTLLESFFSLHIFLLGVIAIVLALWALRMGGRRGTMVILWVAIASTVGAMVPLGALVGAAHRSGTS